MNRCPNCQKEIDIEHYKKRGNCKFCGYKLDLDSSDDSSSKSKLIRTSANKIKNKGNISESSNKSSQKQLLNEKTVQTEQEYIPDIAPIDSSDKSISDDVQPISLSHGTEKTETLKKDITGNKTDSSESKSNLLVENLYEDPIFLNNAGPLDFNDPEEEVEIETDQLKMTNDSQINYKTDQSSVPSDQENKAIKKVWKPLIFRLLLYIIKKYHDSRTEQFESDMDFHFNDDKYYNDNLPQVLPGIDTISITSILKVVGSILALLLFILFIIYYA